VNRKKSIMMAAVRLFALQGYEATTTLQVAREVGVTEPTVFYHYKNKSHFFNTVLEDASQYYFERLDALELPGLSAFECIVAIFRLHFSVVEDEPLYMRILLRTCPVRLEDPSDMCTKIYHDARSKLKGLLGSVLEKGISSGEFNEMEVDATSNMIIAMLNGLMRQQIASMDKIKGVEDATIEFCRNALVIKK
jgi:AcrR family transcriptional regulator